MNSTRPTCEVFFPGKGDISGDVGDGGGHIVLSSSVYIASLDPVLFQCWLKAITQLLSHLHCKTPPLIPLVLANRVGGSGRSTPDRFGRQTPEHLGRRTPDPHISGRQTPDHMSGRRTPEPQFRNPRVGALFNKWRNVWLMAMERQRRLQDALDHLNEVSAQSLGTFCSLKLPQVLKTASAGYSNDRESLILVPMSTSMLTALRLHSYHIKGLL